MPSPPPVTLLDAARGGDRAALARLLSHIERGGDAARQVGRAVGGATPTYTVGITGAPGAGKSTLTSAAIDVVRAAGQTIAVLAVDPSSPFTGGAILGDRVRMGDHALDNGVFIRSMATRGHMGGLAVAAPEAVRVLGAVGFDWVLVETVGVGQVEVEVAGQTDTTVVVVNPGWGDAVQAAKAGLMEIADVFVVNKADRPGASDARRDLDRMLDLAGSGADQSWRPPVLLTTSTSGEGVPEVWAAVAEHRAYLESGGELTVRRRHRAAEELTRLVGVRLMDEARALTRADEAEALVDAVLAGEIDAWAAADRLLTTPRPRDTTG